MKRTASQQGRRSRLKGSTWERQVARDLRPVFGPGVKRGLAQSRFGRGEAPDVDCAPPLWVETKHGKTVLFQAALRQAEEGMAAAARPGDRWPIAVCKVDRTPPVVMMRWEHFLELVTEWHGNGSPRSSRDPASARAGERLEPATRARPTQNGPPTASTPPGVGAAGARDDESTSDD